LNSTPRSQPPEFSWARVVFLLACLVLNACSQASKRAADATSNRGPAESTQATPASPASTASPTPEIEPLKVPERVAAGEVTEQGGPWNRAVQRITYLSTADKTRQPMMFYKPKPNYWGALLWRKLMGTTVLESGIPLQTGQV